MRIKSRSNQYKHGIDFEAVESVFNDRIDWEIPAKTADEPPVT